MSFAKGYFGYFKDERHPVSQETSDGAMAGSDGEKVGEKGRIRLLLEVGWFQKIS